MYVLPINHKVLPNFIKRLHALNNTIFIYSTEKNANERHIVF